MDNRRWTNVSWSDESQVVGSECSVKIPTASTLPVSAAQAAAGGAGIRWALFSNSTQPTWVLLLTTSICHSPSVPLSLCPCRLTHHFLSVLCGCVCVWVVWFWHRNRTLPEFPPAASTHLKQSRRSWCACSGNVSQSQSIVFSSLSGQLARCT